MKPFLLIGLLWAGSIFAAMGADLPLRPGSPATALDRYVAAPDASFHWEATASTTVRGATVHSIRMVSQTWLTPTEVDHPEWTHWLTIVVPEELDATTGLLLITGGSINRPAPSPGRELVEIAVGSKSVVAELHQVPSQPLMFGGDGQHRVEDDFISFTWDKFLRTGDERWPARLPMTKAAVRAMDVVTAFCATPAGGKHAVDTFVVAGASKRGWTTWTTAAVDPRVIGFCPVVIDVLNQGPSMEHHYRAYGTFSSAIDDYTRQHIMEWRGTSEMAALNEIEDPYSYRARYTVPKLVMNATGDQYFLPDSSQFYFDNIPAPKYLRYVPNTDHSMAGTDAYATVLAWHDAVAHHRPLPRFSWKHSEDGSVEVMTEDAPLQVVAWQAFNPGARDFRLEMAGPIWKSTPLESRGDGRYVLASPRPATGWAGFFVELTFNLGGPVPLKVTTDVTIVPESLPYAAPVFTPLKGYLHP